MKVLENTAVIDPLLIGIKMAEMVVDLNKVGIQVISQIGFCLKVSEEDRKKIFG